MKINITLNAYDLVENIHFNMTHKNSNREMLAEKQNAIFFLNHRHLLHYKTDRYYYFYWKTTFESNFYHHFRSELSKVLVPNVIPKNNEINRIKRKYSFSCRNNMQNSSYWWFTNIFSKHESGIVLLNSTYVDDCFVSSILGNFLPRLLLHLFLNCSELSLDWFYPLDD